MKKIIFTFILIIFSITFANAKTTQNTFTSKFIGNYHYVFDNLKFGDFEIFRRDDSEIAYCIEPGTPFNDVTYTGSYDLSLNELANISGIDSNTLESISIAAYYGYGYDDHLSTPWIVATQSLIWELLGHNFSFTSRNLAVNPKQYVIDTPPEIKEKITYLKNMINKEHEKIELKDETILLGDTLEIKNDLLNYYTLETKDPSVTLTNDTLKIKGDSIKTTEITLKKINNIYSTPYIIYTSNNSQNLFLKGNLPDTTITFKVTVLSTSLNIFKYNEETKSCSNSDSKNMADALYGLYDRVKNLIKTFTISSCKASISNIGLGTYFIKELESPSGYVLDDNYYAINVSKENINKPITLTIYEKEDKKSLLIHKSYLHDNKTFNEINVTFKITNLNTLKEITVTTDKEGNIKTTLPYGQYMLTQVSGKDGFKFVGPQTFIIDKNTKDLVFNLVNEPILKNVTIIKKDNLTNLPIKNKSIKFKLYSKTSSKYICENSSCIYETNKDGLIKINNLPFGTYTLEEIDSYIEGYLINHDKLEFTIDAQSNDDISYSFYNTPILGKIFINKKDETNKPLSNVSFAILASTDIFINNRLYHKNDLIETIITNDMGIAFSSYLPLGIYYLKETNALENYIKDEYIYTIELKNETSDIGLIEKNITIINYKIPKTNKNKKNILLPLIFLSIGLYYVKKRFYYNI